ncbi:helix-turn-helix domain-containing protein [Pumilibacter muris]|uniref:helix-turn-helix domain-containing protein n=1 Tax=Pumilibacter muris TaxID=2941510 RepID=UPI00203F7828|nr:AraC family transcriptional regulator [Pumilibacter muris]
MEPLINKILPYTQLHLQYENFEMNAHRHHTIELLYIIRGTMSVIFEDEKLQTECVLKSNQFLLILPQYKHRYSIKSHTEINILELGHANPQIPFIKWLLSGDYADRFAFTEKLFQTSQQSLLFDDTQNVHAALERLILLSYQHEHNIPNEYFHSEYEIALLDLFVKICRCNRLLIENVKSNRYISHTLLYIAENYGKKTTISQIADFVGVTPSYLQRIFKQSYGETILSALTKQRIGAAAELLKNSDMSVSEIGKKVGYTDKRIFLAAFKKIQNTTPAEYRKNSRAFSFALYRDYSDPKFTLDVDTEQFT